MTRTLSNRFFSSYICKFALTNSPASMAMGAASAGSNGLFKFLKPSLRPQSTDITAAAAWGVAATTTALWIVQPFDWLKKQLFEKPEQEN